MPDEIAISTRDVPGTFDAVVTAKPGEPIFTLQGGDPLGADTVLHWVKLARKAAMVDEDERRASKLLERATVAETVAWAMRDYRAGVEANPELVEDEPDVEDVPPSEAESDRRTRLIRGAEKLHAAVAAIVEVANILDEVEFMDGTTEAELRGFAALVKNAATQVEPRRGNERS